MGRSDASVRRLATAGSLALLLAGLVIDLASPQSLVIAILYDIPIALSGLANSRRLTVAVTLLAVVNDLLAGYANAVAAGGLDATALLNRGLALLSFVLIFALTLALRHTSAKLARLEHEGEQAQLEHDLRHFGAALSGPLTSGALLREAARQLRELLGAAAVVIVGLEGARFAEPRYAEPADTALAQVGSHASWAVDALPLRPYPTITVRTDEGPITIGRLPWRDGEDLVVVASHSSADEAAHLLAEALVTLTPLLARAEAQPPEEA